MIIFLAILFVAVVVVGAPILSILSINQLFGTAIELSFINWLAAFWLSVALGNLFRASGGSK